MADRYEKRLRSLQAEMDEKNGEFEQAKEHIVSLNKKCAKLTADFESMAEKKKKYHHQFEKYSKMSERLQNEKNQLEERQ